MSVVSLSGDHALRVAADEELAGDAGTLHAGERSGLFEHAVVKISPLRRWHQGRTGECDQKNPLRPESRIDVLDRPQASDQKTGAHQQNDRQREFRHYESAADTTHADSAGDTSSSLLARGPQAPPRHS